VHTHSSFIPSPPPPPPPPSKKPSTNPNMLCCLTDAAVAAVVYGVEGVLVVLDGSLQQQPVIHQLLELIKVNVTWGGGAGIVFRWVKCERRVRTGGQNTTTCPGTQTRTELECVGGGGGRGGGGV